MDATAALAARLASTAVAPLIRRLFVPTPPGAALVEEPVRIAGLISFRGERRTLGAKELRALATELTARAVQSYGPHEAPTDEVRAELADALALALHSLGDLDMDDLQAVRLGPERLAAALTRPAGLSAAADAHYQPLLTTACLHILNFFTQRSGFVARTLVEQTRTLDALAARTDLLMERLGSRLAEDTRFERRYCEHITRKHGELTIYGLDLDQRGEWRLDTAYISLRTAQEGESLFVPLSAERALAGQGRVLLRGEAGSGKTTLVQWLAVATARQDLGELGGDLAHLIGRVPFVLPLRRVMRDGLPPTPGEFLSAVRSSVAGSQPGGWADRVLGAGRGLLLIDGIDEVSPRDRDTVRSWLWELMGDFPGNQWVVTSRPSAVAQNWLSREGFTELTLHPMSHDDTTHFIRRWHRAADTDPALATALLDAIRASTALGRLAVNPLMCGLLCALHRERHGFLPHGRKDLYDAALRMLLERRDAERGVAYDEGLRLSSETQILLLQKLAHWMIRNDSVEMERSDALTQVGRALEYMPHVGAPPERVLRHLLVRSGLLREPAHGRVDFVHRTFMDYLGAKALVEEGDFPLLLRNATRDQWEDVVRMAVALGRPAERERILRGLIEGITTRVPDAGVHGGSRDATTFGGTIRRALLAATCLEHATEIAPGTRRAVLDRVEPLVPPASLAEAHFLADTGGPMALGLLPGPDGLDEKQAYRVVVTASRVGTDAALPVLARYRSHPALRVRRQLSWAWYHFDTQRYADEVLAHVDETDLYFAAHNPGHLRALRALGGRARVQVVGVYRPGDLVEHLDPERLTHLWLRNGFFGDAEWLRAFPRLRTLVVPEPRRERTPEVPSHITVELAEGKRRI
ncbi:NACHT domain-containing protein [Streptomyces sp. NPDC001985]|uniref:NACHT domain-containing protein n=1 Tax=Streptomyces sp. NPDC001985 TaxID=3154406 RepID=UPI00331EA671